jgi:hypothetical protein
VDFHAKTDATLERYKKGREALERQVRDLEAELRRAQKVRRGAELALEETDATMNTLQRKTSRIEEENEMMVQLIVGLTKELQEARDSEEEAWLLRTQWVQMFHEVLARVMEAARRLGIEGLILPPVLEDDGAILRFFCQLSDKLVEAAARVTELIDTECRELLEMAGTRIFSNLQRLCPDLDLLDILQRREITPLPLRTAKRLPEQHAWTSPSSTCRQSTPARARHQPQGRRAPPAMKRRAPGNLAMKKLRSPATKRRQSPATKKRQPPRQA